VRCIRQSSSEFTTAPFVATVVSYKLSGKEPVSELGVQYKRPDWKLLVTVDIENYVAVVEKGVTPNFTGGCGSR
jgi:hypothetical protein